MATSSICLGKKKEGKRFPRKSDRNEKNVSGLPTTEEM